MRSAIRLFRALAYTLRQIVGAPDYDRYLAHHAACHPERAPLGRREYYGQFIVWRFGSGPSRCC